MKSWTYEKAGVPHLKGDPSYNREIVKIIRSTLREGVVGKATGFAALFDLKKAGVRAPLLVATTDGVGTKLEIARLRNRHDTIGIDLVAMCVNDLITTGARPLFFLDYFATGRFDAKTTREVLKGIARGCREAGCALIGGETAVMPGFYSAGKKGEAPQYDLAGFAVGVVERRNVLSGQQIQAGDALLGIASSGFHSNGYSLLRRIFSERQLRGEWGRKLLTPTRIYVRPILSLLQKVPLKGIVHITGGGLVDNLPRVIPPRLGATILRGSWPEPKIFQLVRDFGNISLLEMQRTFNLGIGMVLILDPRYVERARQQLGKMRLASWEIGEIHKGKGVEVL